MRIERAKSFSMWRSNDMRNSLMFLFCGVICFTYASPSTLGNQDKSRAIRAKAKLIRVGAAQPRSRLIDWRLTPAEALSRLDKSLEELAALVDKAGSAGCDVVALPEDTTGLLHWESGHKSELQQVLPEAVKRMLDRLGRAASAHNMYLVCCNDTFGQDGAVRNTAFLIGRNGKEIGRYYKVNMPLAELDRKRGTRFPVFETHDLGGVGMLICYDMIFPEAARCLALGGADIVFHPTLGGAAIGDDDISLAAFRTRAVENFIYLVVSQRGGGAMIISPQGKILAEGHGPDNIAIADIDPFGGREGGDATNYQRDMRARLFRERSPSAFGILTDPNPPVLKKVPETITVAEAVRISAKTLTTGNERFHDAETLARKGMTKEAIAAFEKLQTEYHGSWVDREATKRLEQLRGQRK
jgi:predicted amidohydrolase